MFCAIEAWSGAMPHDEIAMCLDIDRMSVCQTEKKVVEKLKKKLRFKALRLYSSIDVSVKGLANVEDSSAIEEITSYIANDFEIADKIEVVFRNKKLELNNNVGKALYERSSVKHKITFNCSVIRCKKDFIDTLTHELFHALQIENKKRLSESIANEVMNQFAPKYYRKSLNVVKKARNASLTGKKL